MPESAAVVSAAVPSFGDGTVIGPGVATVSGKVWVFLGATGPANAPAQNLTASVYDPGTLSWTVKSSTTSSRFRFVPAVAVIGSKVYLFGGAAYPTPYTVFGLVYDTIADTWTDITAAPAGVSSSPYYLFGVAGVIGGLIYYVWGNQQTSGFGLAAYDPVALAWTTKTAPPNTPRNGGCAVGTSLYLLSDGAGTAHKYDSVSDTWSTVTLAVGEATDVLGVLRSDGSTVTTFGGQSSSQVCDLDTVTDTAVLDSTLGTSYVRWLSGMTLVPGDVFGHDTIHVIGGYDNSFAFAAASHLVVSFPVLRRVGPADSLPVALTFAASTLHAATIRPLGPATMALEVTATATRLLSVVQFRGTMAVGVTFSGLMAKSVIGLSNTQRVLAPDPAGGPATVRATSLGPTPEFTFSGRLTSIPAPPVPPGNLKAIGVDHSQILVTWTPG